MATSDAKRTTTIKLEHDGDEIRVNPSVEVDGSVTIHLTDSQEVRPCVGIASPAECDALIAAIGRALGRPAPTSTPLEERLAASLRGAQQAKPFATDQGRAQAIVEVWERALAMVREQGPTVLRAGVLPILDDLKSIATALDFENTPGACSAWRRLEEAIGTLAKLTAPPTTQTEKG